MGQVGFHRTVPLVLHGTGGIGRRHTGLRVLVGQVGFHRTVPLVLHGTSGIGRTRVWDRLDTTGLSHLSYMGHWISWDAGGIMMAYLDISEPVVIVLNMTTIQTRDPTLGP